MIRSRRKRNRRQARYEARRTFTHDCGDDRLTVLVRILARQAARERFDREAEAERDTPPGVTLH